METRRSKRKEAAASESLPPEPRNKRARRAQIDKVKANTTTKTKSEGQSAGPSTVPDSTAAQAPKPAVPKVHLQSETEPAAAETAAASTSQPEAHPKSNEIDLDKSMGSRKELTDAQERAAMEQVKWNLALYGIKSHTLYILCLVLTGQKSSRVVWFSPGSWVSFLFTHLTCP